MLRGLRRCLFTLPFCERRTRYRLSGFLLGKWKAIPGLPGGRECQDGRVYFLHFQKKHPVNRVTDIDCPSFYLLPQEFREKQPGAPGAQTVKELSGYLGEEAEQAEKKAYIKKKLGQFASCSLKQKRVWLKQKLKG